MGVHCNGAPILSKEAFRLECKWILILIGIVMHLPVVTWKGVIGVDMSKNEQRWIYQTFGTIIDPFGMQYPMYSSSSSVTWGTAADGYKSVLIDGGNFGGRTCWYDGLPSKRLFYDCIDVGEVGTVSKAWESIITNDAFQLLLSTFKHSWIEHHGQEECPQGANGLKASCSVEKIK